MTTPGLVAAAAAGALLVAVLGLLAARAGARIQPPDFSPEYRQATSWSNPRWRSLHRVSFALTLGRDALVPLLKARDLDHLSYRRLGHELPVLDVVPLSRSTHQAVTFLRRAGLRSVVNLVLRLAYATWLAAWLYGAWVLSGYIARLTRFI